MIPYTEVEIGRTELSNGSAVFSDRYEVEINKRTAAENEFVVLKKVRWVRLGYEG